MLKTATLLANLSALSVVIPLSFFVRIKKPVKDRTLLLLLLLLTLAGLTDFASYLCYTIFNYPQLILVNFFLVFQFFIISLLFARICHCLKRVVFISNIIYLISAILNSIFFQPLTVFQSNIALAQDVLFICYALIFFHSLLKGPVYVYIGQLPPFWIVTAIFFYCIISLYLFILSNYVFVNLAREYRIALWMVHNFSNILENVIFSVAMYYGGKSRVPVGVSTEK